MVSGIGRFLGSVRVLGGGVGYIITFDNRACFVRLPSYVSFLYIHPRVLGLSPREHQGVKMLQYSSIETCEVSQLTKLWGPTEVRRVIVMSFTTAALTRPNRSHFTQVIDKTIFDANI